MLLKHKLFRWQVLSLFEKVHSRELTRQILISFRLFKKTRFECSVIVLTNFLKKKIDRTKNHIPFIFRQVIPSIRDPRTSVPWSAFSSWSIFRSVDPCPQSHFYFKFFNNIQTALVLNKSPEKIWKWSGFCFQKWQWVTHPRCNFFSKLSKIAYNRYSWILFPKMTLHDAPKWPWILFPKMTLGDKPGLFAMLNFDLEYLFLMTSHIWRHIMHVHPN